jgi:hypothetical protein
LSGKSGVLKKLLLVTVFFFFLFHNSVAQDSCHLRISLITCSPGEELYSSFGHTAIRVTNTTDGTDLFFNYGTFEFNDEFYMKFIRGKLDYFLSIQSREEFMYQYELEGRRVAEQEVNLSCNEKEKINAALFDNAREENKYYRYDFLFDNCTTRAGKIIDSNTNAPVIFKNVLPPNPPSFRDLIHDYLNAGEKYWSKLGIDILLGAKLDRKATNEEAIHFLPDYLKKGFDSATVNNQRLVRPSQRILARKASSFKFDPFTPFIVLTVFAVVGLILLTWEKGKWRHINGVFNFLLFFIIGLAGLLLLFMWFGTDHKVCQNNYNLFWALPTHSVMAFFVHSQKRWVKLYFLTTFWISLILLLTWFFLPQQMNNSLIPVVLLIIFRSWHLSKTNSHETGRAIA